MSIYMINLRLSGKVDYVPSFKQIVMRILWKDLLITNNMQYSVTYEKVSDKKLNVSTPKQGTILPQLLTSYTWL